MPKPADCFRIKPQSAPEVLLDSDAKAFATMCYYARFAKRPLTVAVTLILAASASLMLSAKFLGLLTDRLVQGQSFANVWPLIAIILGFESLNVLLMFHGKAKLAATTNDIMLDLRKELFAKVSRLPLSYFDQQPLGRILTRLTSDVDGIEKFFTTSLSKVLAAVISITTVLCAMLLTDFRFGILIVASALPAIGFTVITRKPVRMWLRHYKLRSAELNSMLAEFISGLSLIKVFGLEQWTIKSFQAASLHQLRAGLNLVNWNSLIRPSAALLCSLPMVAILWWGGHSVLAHTLSVGVVVSFVRFAERFFWPILAVTQEIHVIQEAFTSSERVRQLLDEKEEDRRCYTTNEAAVEPLKGDIHFDNVWMGYAPRAEPILKGISFRARPGMKVGLVGATGSGKSSTMSLLPGLYPLLDGSIEVDGKALTSLNLNEFRSQLGMVSQDVIIFRGTLRDNLTVALAPEQSLSDDALMAILGRSGFARIMRRFKAGLDTAITDGGENLSVGERQLIAFARMMIKNPRLMILDEATANIDEDSERELHEALHELMQERTCFVIAHRLTTIRAMDHILVFDQGSIVEQGTHEELLAQAGVYAQLIADDDSHKHELS